MTGEVMLPPAARLSKITGRDVTVLDLRVGDVVRGYDIKQVRPAAAKITSIDWCEQDLPGITLYVQNLPTIMFCAMTNIYGRAGIVPAHRHPSSLASPCGLNPRTLLLREVMQYRDADDLIPAMVLRWEGDCDFLLVESLLCGSTFGNNG